MLKIVKNSSTCSFAIGISDLEFLPVKGKVVALKIGEEFVSEIQAGSLDCGVILDETSFYAEGGGQVSDVGELLADPSGVSGHMRSDE